MLRRVHDQPAENSFQNWLEWIGTALGCDWGAYWQVENRTLHAQALWTAIDAPTLVSNTSHRRLDLGEGTAGLVWRTRRPMWTTNLVSDMCLPRSLNAQSAGFKGGVWFPVQTDSETYAIVELLGRTLPPARDSHLVLIEKFGRELGAYLADSRDDSHRPGGTPL